jgi:hypothetical protein
MTNYRLRTMVAVQREQEGFAHVSQDVAVPQGSTMICVTLSNFAV